MEVTFNRDIGFVYDLFFSMSFPFVKSRIQDEFSHIDRTFDCEEYCTFLLRTFGSMSNDFYLFLILIHILPVLC